MLDNKGLLNYIGIHFNLQGKNTARNAVSFQCPFCGDKSDHGNLSIFGTYKCWRCGTYRLGELLKQLGFDGNLNEFFTETGFPKSALRPGEYTGKHRQKKELFKLPGNELNVGAANYLKARGYNPKECKEIYGFKSYGHVVLDKDYFNLRERIIVPIHDKEGELVSWVARDYTGNSRLRYLTPKPGQCVKTTKEVLYNQHLCSSDYAIVCEGVFDALKIGIGAIATFGISLTGEQLSLLAKYRTLIWLWDNEGHAQDKAKEYARILRGCGKNQFFGFCPSADPGELTYQQAGKLKMQLLQEYVF
jgi:hypothetical protein